MCFLKIKKKFALVPKVGKKIELNITQDIPTIVQAQPKIQE